MNNLHSFVLGVNHRTSTVELRDKLGVPEKQHSTVLQSLKKSCFIKEVVLISTCNRLECYGVSSNLEELEPFLYEFWAKHSGLSPGEIKESAYFYSHADTVEHLFRVSCSLDSLIVGEGQILGQVKKSYFIATDAGTTGIYLNHLFQQAISLGKRVRTETEINQGAVSISFAAVEICKKVFQDLSKKSALIVGVGEMARLAATHLKDAGIKNIVFANRTIENAVSLCNQFNADVFPIEDIPKRLEDFDLVISCTGAPGTVISQTNIKLSQSKRKSTTTVYVDIAAPSDIELSDQGLPGVFIFNIDDLKNVVDENQEKRMKASQEAEKILFQELSGFRSWYLSLNVVPLIKSLRESFQETLNIEVNKTANKLSVSEQEATKKLGYSLVNKLLHKPCLELKKLSEEGIAEESIWVLSRLFDLEIEKGKADD